MKVINDWSEQPVALDTSFRIMLLQNLRCFYAKKLFCINLLSFLNIHHGHSLFSYAIATQKENFTFHNYSTDNLVLRLVCPEKLPREAYKLQVFLLQETSQPNKLFTLRTVFFILAKPTLPILWPSLNT